MNGETGGIVSWRIDRFSRWPAYVDATCGFGVSYCNIHAPNESASVADIPAVYRVYRDAVCKLLRAQ